MTGPAVSIRRLRRVHRVGDDAVVALDGIDLDLAGGSLTAVVGPSGSGKSTLAMILGGLDRPTSGLVVVGDKELTSLNERRLLAVRRTLVSIVVQRPERNLLGYGTAADNVRFAQKTTGRRAIDLPDPNDLLDRVGLTRNRNQPADQLSGGERQRLSLAVGLATGPGLLLLDEPTSQLDGTNRNAIAALLLELHERYAPTMVVVTHDETISDLLGRSVRLQDGRAAP